MRICINPRLNVYIHTYVSVSIPVYVLKYIPVNDHAEVVVQLGASLGAVAHESGYYKHTSTKDLRFNKKETYYI